MWRTTLAAQLLRLQLLIVVVVLVAIGGLSLAQSSAAFQRDAGRRAQSAAETLAANPVVRQLLPSAQPRIRTGLQSAVESVRAVSGLDYAQLRDIGGTVVLSTVPDQIGTVTDADVSWVGLVDSSFGKAVEAHVPVLDDSGTLVGTAVVGDRYPSALDRFLQSAPNLIVYLAVASVLGGVGSVLLARRVKRQTLGMEASEILDLVGQREAMLRGIKEGVIALDPHGRVLLMSESAHELLHIDHGSKGRTVDELGVTGRLREVLLGTASTSDEIVLVGDRVLVLNTVPIVAEGKDVGTVTTFRDRTELTDIEEELGVTKTSSTALREHIHEFDNQLHTISGLVQLQEYDEVVRYVDGLTAQREDATSAVTDSVADVGVAALLIAKIGAAAHRSVTVDIVDGSSLGSHGGALSRDLCTVLGNLVDNAVTACEARVRISLRENADGISVVVFDDGPGVPVEDRQKIFDQGWSTRGSAGTGHGFGLALVRLACRRRRGDVTVSSEDGWTVFHAVMKEQK